MKDFDKTLAEAERIGAEVDKQFLSEVRNFEEWKGTMEWEREKPRHSNPDRRETVHVKYRIQTNASDGSPRTFEVSDRGQMIEELDGNGNLLGILYVRNENHPSRLDDVKNLRYSVVVGYDSPDDPDWNGRGIGSYVDYHLEGGASTKYGWIQERDAPLRRARYVAPGVENLPDPIDKLKETTDMLKRGHVTDEAISPAVQEERGWKPVAPSNPAPSQVT